MINAALCDKLNIFTQLSCPALRDLVQYGIANLAEDQTGLDGSLSRQRQEGYARNPGLPCRKYYKTNILNKTIHENTSCLLNI